jgi:hypothetical protein
LFGYASLAVGRKGLNQVNSQPTLLLAQTRDWLNADTAKAQQAAKKRTVCSTRLVLGSFGTNDDSMIHEISRNNERI